MAVPVNKTHFDRFRFILTIYSPAGQPGFQAALAAPAETFRGAPELRQDEAVFTIAHPMIVVFGFT